MKKLNKIITSAEIKEQVEEQGADVLIKSPFPTDRHDCECIPEIVNIKKGGARKYITCPRTLEDGMKKYVVTCSQCSAVMAHVHAPDKSLTDWCDLHYLTQTKTEEYEVEYSEINKKGKEVLKTRKETRIFWHGCMAVNISPIDQSLGFECTCGQDTRDFRANTTLPSKEKEKWVKKTQIGRKFGETNSQFKVKEMK